MSDFDRLSEICTAAARGLDEKYSLRLKEELGEIKKKGEEEAGYFLKFFDRGVKVERNEHNLMVAFLLGICPAFDIDKFPKYVDGDTPDIDIDYHPGIRDYLKEQWTFERYGKQHVCNIVSYQTYGVKSALLDTARVLCEDRDEILAITTRLGMKDDDGEAVTFEGMEADFSRIKGKVQAKRGLTKFEKLMLELEDYRARHPNVWEVARQLVSSPIDWKKYNYKTPPRRKKSMGMHASGLIVTGVNLSDFVPLVTPPGSREKGIQAVAWVEGLADTDCSSVGLVKFDYLALEAIAKIAECNRLIMSRHGLTSICALPGLSNWSDTRYLNDPKCLEMANRADLKGIFQFDSSGIRKLVKKCGVNSFDDMIAITSLYRPGPMDCLYKKTKVLVSSGWKPIEDVDPKSDRVGYVVGDGELRYTGNWIKSEKKVKKLLKIKLKNGAEILCSPDHRFLTSAKKFVPAAEITPGMKVAHSITV